MAPKGTGPSSSHGRYIDQGQVGHDGHDAAERSGRRALADAGCADETAHGHSPQMPSKPMHRENYSAGTKQLLSPGLSGRTKALMNQPNRSRAEPLRSL